MIVFEKIAFDEFLESIKKYIDLIGYKMTPNDNELLLMTINADAEKLKNQCNTGYIPDGLTEGLKKKVVGNFLNIKYLTSSLGENFDFTRAVKVISEGDVSYTFADGMSTDDKFSTLIESLISGNEADYVCYRRLKW